LEILPSLVRPLHPWKDMRAWQALTRRFRQLRPELVHTHSGKAGVLGRLAARRAGVPLIVHTLHGPSFGPFQGRLANSVFCAAERLAGRNTTHFVAVADSLIRQYLAAGIGVPEQYTRIYSGFPLQPFLQARNDPDWRQRWGIAPDEVVVGKIARLFKLKGHEDLIRAAPAILAQWPRLKFVLVGDGAWRNRWEREVKRLGVENHFLFTGLVPPAEVPRWVGIMDMVVHLSRREGLPRALPQALAAGRPVIAYDCDGAGEVCRDGETGFLLPPGADIAPAVLALARDADLRRRLGEAGRAWVQQEFDVELMVERIWQLYQRLRASPQSA
jgi:glycosyltransferase involved in cell wall biosynthesis